MKNFDKFLQNVKPEYLAKLLSDADGDACVNCPASRVCNIDDYNDIENPNISDCCRGEFLKWANTEDEEETK